MNTVSAVPPSATGSMSAPLPAVLEMQNIIQRFGVVKVLHGKAKTMNIVIPAKLIMK